jgi:hypothetical protein
MYLEISPRQSGKTERMVESIADRLQKGGTIFLQVANYHYFQTLEKRIREKMKLRKLRENSLVHVRDPQHYRHLTTGMDINPTIYADEFDSLGNDVILTETGYYQCTPKYMRTDKDIVMWLLGEREDPLLWAIQMNGGKYEVYSPMNMFMDRTIRDIRTLRRQMPGDIFRVEMMGNLFT